MARAQGSNQAAVALLTSVLERMDGQGNDDWMHVSPEKAIFSACVAELIAVLV